MDQSDDMLIYNSEEAAESYAARKGMKVVERHPDHLVVKTRKPVRLLRLAFYRLDGGE